MNQQIYDYDASLSQSVQGKQQGPVVREQSTYMTDKDAEKMCSLFADGLDSGIGYARILDFMERQKLDSKMIQRMRYSVLELGDQLGEAFARFGVLDPASRKLILVAEEQGALPETFREQAKMFGQRYVRRKKIMQSFIEPVILFCLGAFYFRNVISHVVEATFSRDTWQVMEEQFIRSTIETAIFCVVGGFIAYLILNMPVDSSFRDMMGRVWFRMPVISKPLRLAAIASFCRYMRQSIRAGIDMYRSIDLAAEASNSPWFMESTDKVLAVMEAGYPLDQALQAMKGIPDEVLDYVGIGEETGKLDEQLKFLGDRYDTQADEAFDQLANAMVYILRMLFIVFILIFAVFFGVLESMTGIL